MEQNNLPQKKQDNEKLVFSKNFSEENNTTLPILPKKENNNISDKNIKNSENNLNKANNNDKTKIDLPKTISVPPPKKEKVSINQTTAILNQRKNLLNKKTPILILFLKYISLVFMSITFAGFLYLSADLSPENKYLELFGLPENTAVRYKNLKNKELTLKMENGKIDGEIKKIQYTLDNKLFLLHANTINNIRDQQLQWFDELIQTTGECIEYKKCKNNILDKLDCIEKQKKCEASRYCLRAKKCNIETKKRQQEQRFCEENCVIKNENFLLENIDEENQIDFELEKCKKNCDKSVDFYEEDLNCKKDNEQCEIFEKKQCEIAIEEENMDLLELCEKKEEIWEKQNTKKDEELINNDLLDEEKEEDDEFFIFEKDEFFDIKYGIFDGVGRIAAYFEQTSPTPILGNYNFIIVENIKANRNEINFGVTSTNMFGKVIFLGTEFIEIINSFPLYKGGFIKNFTREQNENGDYEMKFSLKLNIQNKYEKDPSDIRFAEYENWLESLNNTDEDQNIEIAEEKLKKDDIEIDTGEDLSNEFSKWLKNLSK